MIDPHKALILASFLIFFLIRITGLNRLSYLYSLIIAFIPISDFFISGTLRNNAEVYYILTILYFIKTLNLSKENVNINDIILLTVIYLLFSSTFDLDIPFLNDIIPITIGIISFGLIKTKFQKAWPYFITVSMLCLVTLVKSYFIKASNDYIVYLSMFSGYVILSLLITPIVFLKHEIIKPRSNFIYSYIPFTYLSLRYLNSYLDLSLRNLPNIGEWISFFLLVISISSTLFWLLKLYYDKQDLRLRVFYLFMAQFSNSFIMGLSLNGDLLPFVVNNILMSFILYIMIIESLKISEIEDQVLYSISILGLISFPTSITFFYKAQIFNLFINNYDWYYALIFLGSSFLIVSSSFFFIPYLIKSYGKSGLRIAKHELVLFAIMLFVIPIFM